MSNGRKSNKCSCVDSSLESVSTEQAQIAELAKKSQTLKLANIERKHKKMELEIELTRKTGRLAAEEWALVLRQQMHKRELAHKQQMQEKELELREKELAYKEQALQYQVQLARLSGTHPVDFVQEHLPTNAYPSSTDTSDRPQDSFTFPSLPSTDWNFLEPSALQQ